MQLTNRLAQLEKLVLLPIAVSCFFAWLYFTTPYGLGISADSAAYLKAATGFVQGRGIELFSSQWPPLYPLFVGIFGAIFKGDVVAGARTLQTLLFAINFLLTYLILSRADALRPLWALAFSTLLNLHWTGMYVHYYAWSEPLYICFILIDLLLLQKLLNSSDNGSTKYWQLLTALIIVASLTVYTRYIGLCIAITNAFLVFMIRALTWRKKILLALPQILLPLALIVPWLNYRSASQDANTEPGYAFQGPSTEKLIAGAENVGRWLWPENYAADQDGGSVLSLCIGVALLLLGLWIFIRSLSQRITNSTGSSLSPNHNQVLINYSFFYIYLGSLLFFLFSIIMTMKLENRYLAPAFLPFMLGVIMFCSEIKLVFLRWSLLLLIAVALSLSYPQLRTRALLSFFNGIELNARSVLAKPLNVFVGSCPPTVQAAADNPWHFELRFRDKVKWLPRQYYYGSHRPNPNYYQEVASLSYSTDLIIVEDMSSEIVSLLDKNPDFTRTYTADGIVWRNLKRDPIGCHASSATDSTSKRPSK